MRLHIYTLSWQGSDKLKNLYPSLRESLDTLSIPWVWHIKDNGSSDSSTEVVKSFDDPNINFIKYPNNKDNYSQGMNFLFKESSPKDEDLILMLNNDVVIQDPLSLKEMIKLIERKDVGLVGAKLNYKDSNKIQHSGVLFHKRNGLPYHYRANLEESDYDKENREYPIVTGAVSLTKSKIFAENLFDEKYHWAFEDCHFSMAVKFNLGLKVVCCGKTGIFHEESASLKVNPMNKLFMQHNSSRFINNWRKVIDVSLTNKYDSNPKFNLIK